MMIAGWTIGISVSHGLQLPITEAQLSEIIFMIITTILAYLDSKYPNTFRFLGNQPQQVIIETEETVLNDEYTTGDDQ